MAYSNNFFIQEQMVPDTYHMDLMVYCLALLANTCHMGFLLINFDYFPDSP